ncbi:SusC/RagA family TonB-linked outer membrane protein [Flavobacterium araucananum]|uniref:SusC/RagA family TonB-linked outer membrane protein n=1 Tax=Flavobacterium araucananum TaxID=946678 RepID=UPI0013FDE83A|nr:SusC/RagA family TonB-linked outer membrane protein [Flavobacterium araucananum]
MLLLVLVAQLTFAQERAVSGTVTDNAGIPLPGVSVLIKGTKTGTQTDFDGKFSIKASSSQILAFSYIGMKAQEVAASSTTINVKLKDDSVELEGVVVTTALGIKREKKSLGYGVSTVSGTDLMRSGESNVIQGLAGKTSGVQITGSGGVPGASSKIVIRGQKSISGSTDPLIIVDGVPFNNDTQANSTGDSPFNTNLSGTNLSNRALDINPNDIESVTVLKGGAAAALYGERAGNGVIIYTTKKGKSRRGIGVDLSFNTTVTTVNKLPKLQSKYAAGDSGTYIAPAQSGPDGLYGTGDAGESNGTQKSWGPLISSVPGAKFYDNPNNFFQTGVGTDTNLAFYGGDDKGTFRTSFGYTKQDGMIPSTGLTRTNILISGERKLTDKFKVVGSSAFVRTATTMVQNGSTLGGVMLGLYRTPTTYDLRDYKNELGFQNTYFSAYDNPFYTANENPYVSQVNRTYGNLGVVYNQSKSLNVTLRGGWDSANDARKQVYAISSFGNSSNDGTGQINIENINTQIFNGDLIFNGLVNLTDHIDLNYTAGGNLRSDFFTDQFSRGDKLAIPNFYNLSNASNFRTSNYDQKIMGRSAYAQADFSLYEQVYITGSIRNDWNSSYGDKKSFSYPAGSVAWLFSKPLDQSWLNLGKIRFGYADVGIAPQAYLTQTYYAKLTETDGYTDGNTVPYNGQNGFGYASTLGQSNLKPERVGSTEIGLELKVLDRLGLNVNVYQAKSKDLLIRFPIAPSSGFSSQYGNYASMENKGIEVEINYEVIKGNDFTWDFAVNWSKNKNKVTSLANGVSQYEPEAGFGNPAYVAIVGKPLGILYGTDFLRDTNGNVIVTAAGLPQADPQQKILGDTNPDWLGGLRNTFTYKGITLSALLDFRHGGDVWDGTRGRIQRYGLSEESAENDRGNYIIPGVHTDGSANTTPISAQKYFEQYKGDVLQVQSQNIENVNWVRLRDVSISYRFNDIQKAGLSFVQNLEITLSGRNLWLDTNYKGVDPETSLTGAGSHIQGFDYFNNPGSKSVSLALKLGL